MDNSLIKDAAKKSPLPSLSVKTWVDDDFAIIEMAGALTLSPSLSQLRETARSMLSNENVAGLILLVAGVTYTDSAGLGELTIVYSVANKRSCPLRIVGVPSNLRKMLDMTRLDELLQPADSIVIAKKQMKA